MRNTPLFTWTATAALAVGIAAFAPPMAAWAEPTPVAKAQSALDGVWRIEKPVVALRTADGAEPPLKPEAAKIYRARQAQRAKGDTTFDSATWCSSLGTPRLLLVDYPFELVVRPSHITFLSEWDQWARVVYMPGSLDKDASVPPPPGIGGPPPGAGPGGPGGPGGPPPGGPGGPGGPGDGGPQVIEDVPTGFSQGHWEGETLVIETDHLLDRTLLDTAGMPHSNELKLTERVHLLSPEVLEIRTRFEDPQTFTKPWESVVTYKRQASGSRYEDVCLDRLQAGEPAVR